MRIYPFYAVCTTGEGQAGLQVGKPDHLSLESARLQRDQFLVTIPSAIYKFELGKVPEFVEGDALAGGPVLEPAGSRLTYESYVARRKAYGFTYITEAEWSSAHAKESPAYQCSSCGGTDHVASTSPRCPMSAASGM